MDASIKSVQELHSLSAGLLSSQETIIADCVSIANLMDEKLSYIIQLRDEAEGIAKDISQEYMDAFHLYAEHSSDSHNLSELYDNLQRLSRRAAESNYIYDRINNMVNVCRGAVVYIAEQTNQFKNDSQMTFERGRLFISKITNDLTNYLEHTKK